ncbi:hypothetical protein H6G18_21060 [Anabaena subtropica FACHB-260]|uniref:7-cyano-7-deazaguanine synthase n=2 Tax=Anabaena TaxID=1163 RepID=A0ABR8CV39_9NOST|nr:hypothetical protein [Anabaena subtropica FACHB-260]
MKQDKNLIIHGEVSPSLLQNLAEFQAAWCSWRPNVYKLVDIHAEVVKEPAKNTDLDKIVSTFSGGLDSCFTVFQHRTHNLVKIQRNLQAGLMIHGFDIPLEEKEVFNNAVAKSKKILSSVGAELITMTTNLRLFTKLNWENTYVTALASCLSLLQRGYTAGLIPSSSYYNEPSRLYPSNPVTDHLLSSNSFRIIHDGAAFTRLEKIRAIANSQEVLQNLRVCWQGDQKDRNCCRCEKCIRNILHFRILGMDLPACFEKDVTEDQILRMKVKGAQLDALKDTLKTAKSVGISDSWVQALEKCIQHNQLRIFLKKHLPSNIQKQFNNIKKNFINN